MESNFIKDFEVQAFTTSLLNRPRQTMVQKEAYAALLASYQNCEGNYDEITTEQVINSAMLWPIPDQSRFKEIFTLTIDKSKDAQLDLKDGQLSLDLLSSKELVAFDNRRLGQFDFFATNVIHALINDEGYGEAYFFLSTALGELLYLQELNGWNIKSDLTSKAVNDVIKMLEKVNVAVANVRDGKRGTKVKAQAIIHYIAYESGADRKELTAAFLIFIGSSINPDTYKTSRIELSQTLQEVLDLLKIKTLSETVLNL